MKQRRPRRRTGDGAGRGLNQSGILDPTHSLARPIRTHADTATSTPILRLLELMVHHILENDEKHTEDDWKHNYTDVRLQIALLHTKKHRKGVPIEVLQETRRN